MSPIRRHRRRPAAIASRMTANVVPGAVSAVIIVRMIQTIRSAH
jgi:hypothetical protein